MCIILYVQATVQSACDQISDAQVVIFGTPPDGNAHNIGEALVRTEEIFNLSGVKHAIHCLQECFQTDVIVTFLTGTSAPVEDVQFALPLFQRCALAFQKPLALLNGLGLTSSTLAELTVETVKDRLDDHLSRGATQKQSPLQRCDSAVSRVSPFRCHQFDNGCQGVLRSRGCVPKCDTRYGASRNSAACVACAQW